MTNTDKTPRTPAERRAETLAAMRESVLILSEVTALHGTDRVHISSMLDHDAATLRERRRPGCWGREGAAARAAEGSPA